MANAFLQGRTGHSNKPGNKARKKLARGPVNRPKLEDVLEKPETSKLTKFWDFLGIRDTEIASVSTPRERGLSISDPLVIFPGPGFGCFHAHSPSVAENAANMDSSLLAPGPFEGPNKQRQIQDARDMYQTVARNAERSSSAVPPYDFIELIGKGGYGRVYKCKEKSTGKLMAVKIINIDDADFQEHYLDKDNTINSFRKEVGILQQLKDSKARNINMIHDAFDLHNQLWIVSDYCTGGSLRTLMRANPPPRRGFEEHFLIPIARELATAIKSVHDIGVIHRDIKCANVYVNEEGDIQLGDFGIVGVVDDGSSKRRTIVGTPHYLPREMHITSSHLTDEAYGTEVDIWSYGITMFEAATGLPPYANVPQNQFHTVVDNPPRLEGDDYSDGLKDFIAFCLDSDPRARPSAAEVLTHPYIENSAKKYPTSILVKLIERYAAWEYKGGQRQSLWAPGGAMGPVNDADEDESVAGDDANEWNFSTSDNFNEAFGRRYSQMMIGAQDFAEGHFDAPAGAGLPPIRTRNLTPLERFRQQNEEMSANRGERSLDRLFKPGTAPYELHTPIDDPEPLSDLPLRSMSGPAPTRESVIDLDSANTLDAGVPTFNFDFGDVPTMKARTSRLVPSEEEEENEPEFNYGPNNKDERRATMDWKFPSADKKRATMEWTFDSAGTAEPESPEANMNLPPQGSEGLPPGFRPQLKHTATEPLGSFKDYIHPHKPTMPTAPSPVRQSVASMIDLDMGMAEPALADPAEIVRPSTATSATGSTASYETSGNPFDMEESKEQNDLDRNRFSYHKQWRSDGGPPKRLSHKTMQMHSRGSSLTGTADLDAEAVLGQPAPAADISRFDYNRDLADMMHERTSMFAGIPHYNTDHWPDFGPPPSLDESPKYPSTYVPRVADPDYPLNKGLRGNGLSSLKREIDFVNPVAPHPDSLLEDADQELVLSEFDRLLDDFGQNLKATSKALRQHQGIDSKDSKGGSSGGESGFESSAVTTGDEDGF
ncbi:kinase-like protein [Hortaea werneckii]|uniref:non-specific serine/threonine protein kinase n=1 Tax=Hortaea werneckii TaxID=91943 RepID=A0A3M7G328_HORWE|nr:kinase-like protein [Hortaea werneckii]RMY95542.1 hypothetical protein D0861_00636 [Hortaea werneckii]